MISCVCSNGLGARHGTHLVPLQWIILALALVASGNRLGFGLNKPQMLRRRRLSPDGQLHCSEEPETTTVC